ncbi:hypothetical protein [Rheinheimera sp.]|uniref:hypothetical protein n=1 Tax=Rheinheimera sp. TaxID=1869214 RepID=UPI0040481F08
MENNKRPDWAKAVTAGDWLMVKPEIFGRGGQTGEVMTEPCDDGVSLDFFCDTGGDPAGVPSQEFWEWDELQLPSSSEEQRL